MNRQVSNGAPKWFKEFLQNDYWHLTNNVSRNTKLLYIILGAIIAAALAVLIKTI